MNVSYIHINGKYDFGSECSLLFGQIFLPFRCIQFVSLQEAVSRKKDSISK